MPEKLNDRLLSWCPDIEPGALEQAERTSRLPFVAGHVALMPDAHWGMGATVGSVIPTEGAIIPAAVGVDIGCGMIAAKAGITASQLPDDLGPLHSAIAAAVPAGVGQGHAEWSMPSDLIHRSELLGLTQKQEHTMGVQFGSLGSGNHFVEVCLDENDDVWVVLHSGSRGIGNQLAKVHIEGAKAMMKRYFIELEDPDLAYFVEGTPEFSAYIAAMDWAQDYAMANRERMLLAVFDALESVGIEDSFIEERINCHHNYTEREHHHGRNVWLTRKGAIRAREGDLGVIPGSMGASSYIVEGLGSKASFCSCSHGAGRRLGRKAAERALTEESLFAAMEGKTWNRDGALLDEHPDAYKDIDTVMANQSDLVKIKHTLHQVLNYKGT